MRVIRLNVGTHFPAYLEVRYYNDGLGQIEFGVCSDSDRYRLHVEANQKEFSSGSVTIYPYIGGRGACAFRVSAYGVGTSLTDEEVAIIFNRLTGIVYML